MVQQVVGNNNNSIIQQQLDAIKKEGVRNNESELSLEENGNIYNGLYKNGMTREELARQIIDQWNIADGKDYFSDREQIQKANSYANYIMNDAATQEAIKRKEHEENLAKRKSEITSGENMKMEDLRNLLQDKPENTEENAEIIVEKSKERLKETINRYTSKMKELNEANDVQKEALKKEIATIKTEIKTDKEKYEQVKKDFFAPSTYNFEKFTREDLKKAPLKMIRYAIREGKLFNSPKLTKMATIRRNITIKKLIRKFNSIGTEEKKGVRFIMGFEKSRFLRYTGIKAKSMMDQAGSAMGMQINPQDFHKKFNEGRKNIFAILDADTGDKLESGEVEIIKAIKARINYYGYTYARERANARVTPFVDAEKNAKEDERILEKTKTIQMAPQQQTQEIAA